MPYRLICGQDARLPVEHIKVHPFFAGVDWESIRQIGAPFVPHLKSITDTSYFPTDELENVPDQPVGADISGANKDLAFVGYVSNCTSSTILVSLTSRSLSDIPSSDSWVTRTISESLVHTHAIAFHDLSVFTFEVSLQTIVFLPTYIPHMRCYRLRHCNCIGIYILRLQQPCKAMCMSDTIPYNSS